MRAQSGDATGPMPRPEPGSCVRIRALSCDADDVAARVIEDEGDGVRLRLSRGADPGALALAAGSELQVTLGRRDSAYTFDATVLSRPDDETVVIRLGGASQRLQRREFFRLAVRLPIAVSLERTCGEEAAESGERDGDSEALPEPTAAPPEIVIFRLADLSGGGCLCLDPDGRLRRGRLYRACLDLHEGPPLQVDVEVVRRGISYGIPSVGLRFVALAEQHRERIMRTLFREHRRRATAGRS